MQIRLFLLCLLCTFSVLVSSALAGSDTIVRRIERITEKKAQVDAWNREIEICWQTGRYEKGHRYASKALKISRDAGYRKGEAEVLNNIGIIYDYQSNFSASLNAYFKALRIQESIRDDKGIAYTCSNIGLIYANQRNYAAALRFHNRSLHLRKKIGFKPGISASYNNIGIVSMYQKNYQEALRNYFASVQIDKELGDETGIADTYNNIAIVYMEQGQYDESEHYTRLSLEQRERTGNLLGVATCYNNLGTLMERKGNYTDAEPYLKKSIAIGKQIGNKETIKHSYRVLFGIYEKTGRIQEAYDSYKLYVAYGDSITNDEETRRQTQTEMQYAFDKKEARSRLMQKHKDEQVKLVLWSVILIAVIILIFSLFLYRRWKTDRAQKVLIEEKNRLVELKNMEILDSISYAKRIQSAILPPEKLVRTFLDESFILYRPKDIVAGDFYWMENNGPHLLFAAADCTGHGVPGALVSVVCHNALNRAVREFGLLDPGKILDKAREIILEEFAKSEDDVNDGMDISLCVLNTRTLELTWAGANNPLWIVRKNSHLIEELKANKQPIGRYSSYQPFVTHSVQLSSGDSLYLFSDGFADQFGGPDERKFKTRSLKSLVLSLQGIPMAQQKEQFEQAFNDWKGELEQVDDVCIIGVTV